ncbi:cell wall-binding repeat-containing protein [Clostridium autoethanogenum]|uniref:Cell wall-binding repeat-containing protein n=1 Tax=Clostridium autoethanogenum DSM 10061 TaxID=1341692 RepID=A0ABN4BPX9_9CLOT|nr:cell wall-binding repeat-containing protein [Clostridium autoethanogenum]AGY78169.1 cell wall-binding repeat-containing protein [Clostridium autoethanogenum DSM 10061]ALU38302.1 Cell wall binding repeat 2-containing protein [Clostridium autoethanogenum DSM 10061]OVY51065.1 N-acetylmuramoyl-L-alanine amidase LytC precursor [Clostridium autoethanogenum]
MKKTIAFIISIVISTCGGEFVYAKTAYGVSRISGANRYETSVNIANNFSSDKLKNVIIVSGSNFPDALAGSVLSKKENAPILLVGKDVNSSGDAINFIKNKLSREGTIYILGGESAVSENFESYFNSLGYSSIKRLGGGDRFGTNFIIDRYLMTAKATPVVIVNAFGFADALSVSSIAASKGYPIIMTNSFNLPDETKETLKNIEPSKVFIIGGESSVAGNIVSQLKETVPSLNSNDIIRIGGMNRYDTSLNVCKYFNQTSNEAVIASGENFPDALSAGALAAKNNAPIILTDGANISDQKQYLDGSKCEKVILVGGTGAVSEDVQDALEGKAVISNGDAKKLLLQGDDAFKKVLKINVDGNSYMDVSGISYAPVTDNIGEYSSISEYLNENYGLNNYYTKDFVSALISFVFKDIDGKVYMRYGNPEPELTVENSEVVSKKYDGNKADITLKGYYYGELSYANATLVYDGNRWLIDKFDNWGVE